MDPLAELLGEGPAMVGLRLQVRTLLTREAGSHRLPPTLIQGETGTGKGLLARLIHRASTRAGGPFVELNCAAIPESLVEAELFGYAQGAFTDARQSKPGLFHTAHEGTLFLDEVGLLPRGLQAKLLTVLEQRAVRRLGATRSEPVNVAIIAATNENLTAAVREGRFREDLYHRLAVLTLELPPLREHPEDVELLAAHVLARVCAEYGLPPKTLARDAREALRTYSWPGNVRELANVIERAALLGDGSPIQARGLNLARDPSAARESAPAPEASVGADSQYERLAEALRATGGNVTRTAARLGITRNTVRAWMQRYGMRLDGTGGGKTRAAPEAEAAAELERVDTATGGVGQGGGVRWNRRRVAFLRAQVLQGPDGRPAAKARLLDRLVEKIHSFGGRVETLGQGGLLAAFGHEPAEDAPRRAANAALAIARAVQRDHEPDDALAGVALGIHVSRVAVADVAARIEIDQDDRREVDGVLAALQPVARAEIAVSSASVASLERHFAMGARSAGEPGHLLVGHGTNAAAAAVAFVGREREIDTLQALLARARQGQGQVVTIIGAPGIGKSRIVHELRAALADDAIALEGRCLAYTTNAPYVPVIEIVRNVCGITDADTPLAIASRIGAGLERLGPALSAWGPYVRFLLEADRPSELSALSPAAIKARTFEAIRQLVLAEQERQPMLLIVEDIHWIDSTSEALLAALAEVLPATRVLLVTTCRPGYKAPWSGKSHATQIALGPLSQADSVRLLESVLGHEGRPDRLLSEIIARGEGNPFFLEELARSALATREDAEVVVPATIHDVVGARLDRLEDVDRQTLDLAAVVGRVVPLSILSSASRLPSDTMRDSLARLQAAEFVYAERVWPEPEYAFKHALTHEVAYAAIREDERIALHGRVASAIEELAPDRGERRPEVLARHFTAAGRPREAIRYLHQAGQGAVQRSANAEAIAHFTGGLALVPALPGDDDRIEHEIRLRVGLAAALVAHHGFGSEELEVTLVRIRELTVRAGQTPGLTPVRFGLWRFALARANFDVAEQLAAELLATSEQHREPTIHVAAHSAAGMTALYLGRLGAAARHFDRVADRPLPVGERAAVLYGQELGPGALGYFGWGLTLMGELRRGVAMVERGLALARESGSPFTIAHGLNTAGLVHCERREPARVAELAREMLVVSTGQEFRFLTALALMLAGWARFAQGDRVDGLAQLREGSEQYRRAHQRIGLRHRAHLAEALLASDAVEEALEIVAEARAYASATRDGLYLPEILRVEGEALTRRAPGDPAGDRALREAIELASQQGAHLLALRAATSLVDARRGDGRRGLALGILQDVYARFTEEFDLADLRRAAQLLSEESAP